MKGRRTRMMMALAVAAGALSTVATPAQASAASDWAATWSALPAPSGTLIASGTLTTDGKTPSTSGTVVLFVEPADLTTLEQVGGSFTALSRSSTDSAGRWSLSVPAGTDLTKNTDIAGNVNFQVRSFDAAGSGSYFFSAKAASSLAAARDESSEMVAGGAATVAGAARTLATIPSDTTGITLNSADAPNTASTGQTAAAGDPIYQCTNSGFQLYGNILVRIGRLYNESATSAEQFTYVRGSSSTLGVGFSGSGAAGSWGVSGTTTTSTTATEAYPLMRGATTRLAYTYYQYDKWVQTCRSYPSGAVVSVSHFFGPSRWIGGQVFDVGTRLGMGYCLSHAAGSQVTLDYSTAYEGGADVASSGVIQINLSARTGYNTATSIVFGFGHTLPLCGWKDYEGGTPQLLTIHGPG